jgi:hypothetical protein
METLRVLMPVDDMILAEVDRLSPSRLARECAVLDPVLEKVVAEEGLGAELAAWLEY